MLLPGSPWGCGRWCRGQKAWSHPGPRVDTGFGDKVRGPWRWSCSGYVPSGEWRGLRPPDPLPASHPHSSGEGGSHRPRMRHLAGGCSVSENISTLTQAPFSAPAASSFLTLRQGPSPCLSECPACFLVSQVRSLMLITSHGVLACAPQGPAEPPPPPASQSPLPLATPTEARVLHPQGSPPHLDTGPSFWDSCRQT